jgi:hypothetical protein
MIHDTASGLVAAPGLDLSATRSWAAGSNRFAGAVTTQNTALTGTADGRFYGPNYEEISGIGLHAFDRTYVRVGVTKEF